MVIGKCNVQLYFHKEQKIPKTTHFNNKSRSIKVRNVKETVLFFALYIVCFFSHQMSCFVFIFSLNSVPDEERQSLIRTAETHI